MAVTTQNREVSAKPKAKPRGRPFASGNRANPGGRPTKDRPLLEALRKGGSPTKLANMIWKLALKGEDLAAAKYIYDRLEGMPTQRHEADLDEIRAETRRLARELGVDEDQAVRRAEAIMRGDD